MADRPRPARVAAAVVAMGLALAACADADEDASAPPAVTPAGFDVVPATVTLADGTVCELCLWEAATSDQRRRGLMGVTDLGAADGMAFVYGEPSSSSFWMRDTPMPLDVAWFDAAGEFVSGTSMTPCLTGPDEGCVRYGASAPYSSAVELPAGELAELAIGPGSVLALDAGAGCDR